MLSDSYYNLADFWSFRKLLRILVLYWYPRCLGFLVSPCCCHAVAMLLACRCRVAAVSLLLQWCSPPGEGDVDMPCRVVAASSCQALAGRVPGCRMAIRCAITATTWQRHGNKWRHCIVAMRLRVTVSSWQGPGNSMVTTCLSNAMSLPRGRQGGEGRATTWQ